MFVAHLSRYAKGGDFDFPSIILQWYPKEAYVKWISINKAQSEDLMQSLLSSPVHSFDEGLQSKLPEKHGVYAISVGSGEDTKFLWVGMTHKSKRGLRRRVWEDHYKNPTNTSDLPKVLLRVQPAWRLGDAKRWITETCRGRWIV